MGEPLRCRLCDAVVEPGLIATGRRACCLNATPIVGACPTHGPVGPENVHRSDAPADRSTGREPAPDTNESDGDVGADGDATGP